MRKEKMRKEKMENWMQKTDPSVPSGHLALT